MQNTVTNNIFKSFGFADADDYIERGMSTTDAIRKGIVEFDDEICKAVYADTAENRKLGRVGQEYHKGRKKQGGMEEPHGKVKEKSTENKESKKSLHITESLDLAEEHADEYMDFQYSGEASTPELKKIFQYIQEKADWKIADWTEDSEELEKWKEKKEKKGYKVIDMSGGSDTTSYAAIKLPKKKMGEGR